MNRLLELLSSDVAHRLGWTLVHSLWLGASAAGLLGAALAIIPRCRSQARYLAGCAALLGRVIA